MTTTRRLAAILAADVAGYSAAMEKDEEGTAAAVRALRREVIEPKLAEHQGRLIKTTGDGFLAEFASPIAALNCALAIQQRPDESGGLRLRIGLNLGDVIIEEGGDLLGEGVNIAARLEGLADPGGILVSDKIVREVEGKVEAKFEDRGDQQVKNLSKPVRAYSVRTVVALGNLSASFDSKPLPLPDKPSIAVLPFQNMSGDPEQDYFADGMVEDIITALSRFKSLFVIARNSSFTYKGKAVDIKHVGRELGVRYVLEGSVRKAGGRVRITGQLIDSETGTHLWADKFDGAMEDVFDLQDRVTETVVRAIAPKLDQAERDRVRRKPVENLDAYDCFQRGMAAFYVPTRESNDEALRFFYRAIELNPGFATAYAAASVCYVESRVNGWSGDQNRENEETRRLVTRVIELGQDDAFALSLAGQAFSRVLRDHESGRALLDQALAINPNLAHAWQYRGFASVYEGEHEAAIEILRRCLRLDPLDPAIWRTEMIMALAHLFLGRFDEAGDWSARALRRRPDWAGTLRAAIAVDVMQGRLADASNKMTRLRQVDPALSLSNFRDAAPYTRPEDVSLLIEAFRLAGMPE